MILLKLVEHCIYLWNGHRQVIELRTPFSSPNKQECKPSHR